MLDACYTAHVTTKDQVFVTIGNIFLPRNSNAQYAHDTINTCIVGCHCVIRSTFNVGNPGKGMEMLLRSSTDESNPCVLSAIKSTNTATIETILAKSLEAARIAGSKTPLI